MKFVVLFVVIFYPLYGDAFSILGYSLKGAANLETVKENTLPELKNRLKKQELELGAPIFIRIFKESEELEIWIEKSEQFVLFRSYPICKYSGELGPKLKEGDRQSPEGFYFVTPIQMKEDSTYHLAFNLGYPNAFDRSHHRTGSYLMVHGNCVSIGCFAMTDKGIEEIYLLADAALKHGQPFFRVHIFPFRMTEKNMIRHKNSKWTAFWENLKEGYDHFEHYKKPPNVEVQNKRYIMEKDITHSAVY